MNEKYLKELLLLAEGLIKRGIQFEFRLLHGGGQISTETWDAVCHDFSYGNSSGELEIMGTLVNNTNDSVEGFLTAKEILSRIDKDKSMAKEEAIKEFVGYQTYDIPPSVEATKMAIEALKAKHWIPVSERLPEENVEVLATTIWGAVTISERISENDWFIYEGQTNADTDEIIAWQPLPQPYKTESEVEE